MEKTDKEFWEDFWKKLKLPDNVNYGFKNDRMIANTIKKYVPMGDGRKTMVEIGCAPGKWLVFFNKELHYKVVGLEYVEQMAEATKKNLELSHVPASDSEIVTADFLKYGDKRKFGAVSSFGFIEHFTNWDEILDKHLAICEDGGYVVIGFPSFRGLNYILQKQIDKHIELPFLPRHNLELMDLEKIKAYTDLRSVNVPFLGYIGGFEPALFNTKTDNKLLSVSLKFFIKPLLTILFGWFNTKYTSSYIMLFMQKKPNENHPPLH